MEGNEYQQLAARTLNIPDGFKIDKTDIHQTEVALRAGSQLGELIDYLKKGIYHKQGWDPDKVNGRTIGVIKETLRFFDKAEYEIHPTHQEISLLWNVIGVAGESGELMRDVHNAVFTDKGLDVEHISKEIGDVMWYLAALCTTLDLNLEDVMKKNIDKLKARYPDGFSYERSTFREGDAN